MQEDEQSLAYATIRQPRQSTDFDWILFTDGSCWDVKQRVYGGAAWLVNLATRKSITTTAGGTDGSTDRSELLAFTNGLRLIIEVNGKNTTHNTVLWVTDRESLALQVAENPRTSKPFYGRSMNLDLWASFDFFLKDHLRITTLFAHRNTVYGQCVVDHISRLTRNALTRQFPAMSGAEFGDYSGWTDLMQLDPLTIIKGSAEAPTRKKFKTIPFHPNAEITEAPTIDDLFAVMNTTGMPTAFNKDILPIPPIP